MDTVQGVGLQGYLAHKKLFPQDPTVGLCPGPYSGPGGGGQFLMIDLPLYRDPPPPRTTIGP